MTREEIENMPAGVEMDAMIANSVMGWKDLKPEEVKTAIEHDMLLSFSSDISAAFQVLDSFENNGWMYALGNDLHEYSCALCFAENGDKNATGTSGASMSLAICRAALLAVIENNQ